MELLGIGSRVEHQHFGRGVVVDIASEFYVIWFKTQNGTKIIYKVKVILEPQPIPIITHIEKDTTEAGLKNIIHGKNFGNFAYGVYPKLMNSQGELT